MTLYLTEKTNKNELKSVYNNGDVFAVKLYPAGTTTNSDSSVKDINKIFPVLEIMTKFGMPLLIHGKVTDKEIDIFDREKVFIDQKLDFKCKELSELKITLEHITTKEANKNLAAFITPHHLALNKNVTFVDGIRPHNYCLPLLKREIHRKSLPRAAMSGNNNFFLETDTAPYFVGDKERSCGCTVVFNATSCLSVLAQIFEMFVSRNGASHYNLDINKEKIKLIKTSNPVKILKFLIINNKIKIFDPNFPVFWEFKNHNDV